MFQLRATQSGTTEKENALELKIAGQGAEIHFDNVYFRYPSSREDVGADGASEENEEEDEDKEVKVSQNRNVLNGTTFTIKAGETVAIVGSSGSGKSTIFRLLYRFYDPQEGCIHVDGQDIQV